MTAREAYSLFLNTLTQMGQVNNNEIGPGRFVEIFNMYQEVWYRLKIQSDQASKNAVDDLQKFVIIDKSLLGKNTKEHYVQFDLPKDFFAIAGDKIKAYAIKNKCLNCERFIIARIVKQSVLNDLLSHSHNRPSFELSETLGTFTENVVKLYEEDFSIDKAYLSYYRKLADIELAGYIRPDGDTTDNDVNPELESRFIKTIIDLCVSEVRKPQQSQ